MNITTIAMTSINISIICSVIILIDVLLHPQKMNIMNVVWPLTALYSGPVGVWAYYALGKKSMKTKSRPEASHKNIKHSHKKPF